MNVRTILIAFLLSLTLYHDAQSREIRWDDLLKAVAKAGEELADDKDRKETLDRLNLAIEKNPKSYYLKYAYRLRDDLVLSIKKISTKNANKKGAGKKSDTDIMDTKIQHGVITDWKFYSDIYLKKNSQDPMVKLMQMDRISAVNLLIPLLEDTSPTRAYQQPHRGMPISPRVCDLAISAIEYETECLFPFNDKTSKQFHKLSPEKRLKVIHRIKKWWKQNKDKTVAEGIRAQLPYGKFYDQVIMAKRLAKHGKKDSEFAIITLKKLLQKSEGEKSVFAARALVEFNDFTAVDIFYSRLKSTINEPGVKYSSYTVSYLTDFGSRREWELLHKLAVKEIKERQRYAGVWTGLINCRKAESSLFAVPGLGLALNQTKITGNGSRGAGKSHTFSCADEAVEHLQVLLKIDFGYDFNASAKQRADALAKAQKWWKKTGKEKYTFDNIEKMINKEAEKKKNAS